MHWTGTLNPTAFEFGSLRVQWYGIFITLGMLMSLGISIRRMRKLGVKTEEMMVLFLIAIPMAIVFARIGSVVANYKEYFVTPYDWNAFVKTIAIWNGGLTILWGVPGGALGGLIWAKIYKKDFIACADIILPTALWAQGLGRWGNFMNQELYGQLVTNPSLQFFPYAVFIADEMAWFQATFFYELVADWMGFFLLTYLCRRVHLRGFGVLSYTAVYTFIRGVLETVRSETSSVDQKLGFNAVQVLCLVVAGLCLVAIVLLWVRARKKGKKVFYREGAPVGYPREPADEPATPEVA